LQQKQLATLQLPVFAALSRTSPRGGAAMNTQTLSQWLLIALIMPVSTASLSADVTAETFDDYCAEPLSADRIAQFDAALQDASTALQDGDTALAESSLHRAESGVYRGGSDLHYTIAVKCTGTDRARQWFDTRMAIQRQTGQYNDPRQGYNLEVVALDGGREAVIDAVKQSPDSQFPAALATLQETLRQFAWQTQFGAFLLPGELQIAVAFESAAGELQKHAARQQKEILAREEQAFHRASSQQEQAMLASVTNAGALAGGDSGALIDQERLMLERRLNESMGLLRAAGEWSANQSDIQNRPESLRARQRGDEMMQQGDDRNRPALSRDNHYAAAIDYYNFGGWVEHANRAATSRTLIGPEVKQAQADQEQARVKAEQQMEVQSRQMQQSLQDMQKTDAERQRFEDETAALEAELDF